jgi:hypothetical protein
MFVLTTSCNATDAINTWTSAYRQSLEQDIVSGKVSSISGARDLIHAIAPEGSFPTSTPSEMLLDFVGPLDSIKLVFEGGTPEDVYKILKNDIKPDQFVNFVRKVENFFGRKKEKLSPIQFKPRYNQLEKDLLDQNGLDYKLEKL